MMGSFGIFIKTMGVGILSIVVGIISNTGIVNSFIVGGLFFTIGMSIMNSSNVIGIKEHNLKIEYQLNKQEMMMDKIIDKFKIDVNNINDKVI